MIKLEEMDKHNQAVNPECKFIDHITWLRRTFERARANSTREKFDEICELQEQLDQFLEEQFKPQPQGREN